MLTECIIDIYFKKGNFMHKLKYFTFVLAAVYAMSTACGQSKTADSTAAASAAETAAETETAGETVAAVASGDETAAEQTLDTTGLVPASAEDLKEGSYDISVESSSSMFKITSCVLTVKDGAMTARMTMGGTGYLYVYMGTGEEAAKVPESDLIPFEENSDGTHSFTVPVKSLNEVVPCAAFSKKKEKWYDRELVFEAAQIPADAFLNTSLKTVEDLALADGTYTAEVALAGGSGRASVESPAVIEVKDGKAEATIIWSSSNYDYVRVDEEKLLPVNTDGNSTFVIPVSGFDSPLTIYADTTAMSTPHEIEYTLTFDSSTLEEQKQ